MESRSEEHKHRTLEIKVEEIFYYLFFGILLFAKGIGLYEGMWQFDLCLVAALLCMGIKICLTEHTVGELVRMGILILLGLLIYGSSGEKAALVGILVVVGMKHVPVRRVFAVGGIVWTAAFFSTIFLALTGLIPDLALVHVKLGLGHIIRWSLGYPHPNVLHISYVIWLAFFFYLACLDRRQLAIATGLAYLFNLYVFLYSVSYTGLILVTVYLGLNLYFNLRTSLSRWEGLLIQCVFPVCAGLSVLGPVLIKGKAFDILNKMMNTRWVLSRYFLTEQRITLFGTRMVDLPDNTYNIDCSYVYVLMYDGILLFLLVMLAYQKTIRCGVQEDRRKDLSIMLAFLVAGMSEPFMANLSFKNLTLLFVGACYHKKMEKKGIPGAAGLWDRTVRLLPWAGCRLALSFAGSGKQIQGSRERITGKWRWIFLVGGIGALLVGSICYKTVEMPDCVYVDIGLSDYSPGERIKLDHTDLPPDFHGMIIGDADGKTEMYILAGNIVKLERVRRSLSVGLAGGIVLSGALAMGVAAMGYLPRKEGKAA